MTHFTQPSADAIDVVISDSRFESSTAGAFCSRLVGEISGDPTAREVSALNIDLSRVESIDSVGATALLRIPRDSGVQASVVFKNAQPSVQRVFELLRLEQIQNG